MDELESDSLQPTIAVVKVEPEIYSEQDSEFASQTLEYEELKVNLDTLGFPQEFRTKSEPYMEENCESYDNLNLTFKNEGEISREELELFVKQEKPDISEESKSEAFKGNNCSTDFSTTSMIKYELNDESDDDEEIHDSHNSIIESETSVRDTSTYNFSVESSLNMDIDKSETYVKGNAECSTNEKCVSSECKKVKKTKERSRKLPPRKFKCELCSLHLSELHSLRTHLRHIHEVLVCRSKNCTFYSQSVESLFEHTEKNHKRRIRSCKKCAFFACNFYVLREHVKSIHELENKNVSNIHTGCTYFTDNIDEMKRHLYEHIASFKCTCCPFVGRNLECLKKHQILGECLKKVDPWGVNHYKEAYLRNLNQESKEENAG